MLFRRKIGARLGGKYLWTFSLGMRRSDPGLLGREVGTRVGEEIGARTLGTLRDGIVGVFEDGFTRINTRFKWEFLHRYKILFFSPHNSLPPSSIPLLLTPSSSSSTHRLFGLPLLTHLIFRDGNCTPCFCFWDKSAGIVGGKTYGFEKGGWFE